MTVRERVSEPLVRALLADGGEQAWGRLARTLAPWLATQLRSYGLTEDDIDDAIQQVLVTLWRAHASIEVSVVGWLRTTTRRVALDVAQRPANTKHVSAHGPEWDGVLHTDPTAAHDARLVHHRLRLVLLALPMPDDVKETFMLRTESGLSYHEIATVQSITTGAAKMRVLRVRAALRAAGFDD